MSDTTETPNNQGAEEKEETVVTDTEQSLQQAEKEEEAKLKAKYPQALRPGASSFLQKRLQKGQKYFDSGDYNMAKAKGQKPRSKLPTVPQHLTGDAIPTPETLPIRKTSIMQSKLANELS